MVGPSCQLHADTSVLAARRFDDSRGRKAAEQALASGRPVVCEYVVHELRATFLFVFARMHKLIVDSDGDVGEALARASHYPNLREQQRAMQLVARFWRNRPPDEDDAGFLWYLEMWIDDRLMSDLLEGVESLPECIECTRTEDVDRWDGRTYKASRRCRRSDPPQCRITEFLTARSEELARLADGPAELDKTVHRCFRQVAREVIENPDAARGRNCFGVLADAIITLQCPSGARVCTTNVDDFRSILSALGRPAPIDARPGPQSGA